MLFLLEKLFYKLIDYEKSTIIIFCLLLLFISSTE